MGSLTLYLQDAFAEHCPKGWVCRREAALVGPEASARLGFAPRVDVVLEQATTSRRVWIEFEVSRADPVANHAKFATARFLEREGRDSDAFVSMASRHIVPGRLALAAGTAMLMRSVGIAAFQVDLLPAFDGDSIKRLNARPITAGAQLDVPSEIDRALKVSDAEVVGAEHRIHKADNAFAVAVSVRQWNADMRQPRMASLWGRRRVGYFVYDRISKLFAPSKFCAFVPTVGTVSTSKLPELMQGRPAGMTMTVYAMLGEDDPRFDGRIAWRHLQDALGYDVVALDNADPDLRSRFETWHLQNAESVHVRGPATILVPPIR